MLCQEPLPHCGPCKPCCGGFPGLFTPLVPPAFAEGGSVLVGGHDVRGLQLDSLRRALGEVPQVGGTAGGSHVLH